MYQALYRKYRPQNFASVVGQDIVKKILINSIKNNKISHAYLFSGPRGIGKTSIAKIFAKAVNCDNFLENDDVCLKCDNCLEANSSVDILEIDAASNNGVDQIRELKSKVNIVPSKLKYKVYIIDEVHMLSNSAFNALLKTLEEPPSHVIFILATTEFYEVPETIVSRCQCFSFNRISDECLQDRLKFIAKEEKIKVKDDVLLEIARYSSGGLRDAISMLDKLASFTNNNIKMADFITLNGLISQEDIISTYNFILEGNHHEILEMINKIDKSGYNFNNFIERVMLYARDQIINFYENKTDNFDIEANITIVNKLNDLLNKLKVSLNPLVITQVSFLELLNFTKKVEKNEKISCEMSNSISADNMQTVDIKGKEDVLKKVSTEPLKMPQNEEKYKHLFTINENIKNIRINNALANANLNYKNNFISNWSKLSDYRLDDKYAKAVQLLSASSPVIVGDKYAVIASTLASTVERMFELYDVIDKLISLINNTEYRLVYVTEKDFENIKNKYITDKKNGIIYKYEDETDVLVINNNKKENPLLNKAIDLFGSDLVDYEEE